MLKALVVVESKQAGRASISDDKASMSPQLTLAEAGLQKLKDSMFARDDTLKALQQLISSYQNSDSWRTVADEIAEKDADTAAQQDASTASPGALHGVTAEVEDKAPADGVEGQDAELSPADDYASVFENDSLETSSVTGQGNDTEQACQPLKPGPAPEGGDFGLSSSNDSTTQAEPVEAPAVQIDASPVPVGSGEALAPTADELEVQQTMAVLPPPLEHMASLNDSFTQLSSSSSEGQAPVPGSPSLSVDASSAYGSQVISRSGNGLHRWTQVTTSNVSCRQPESGFDLPQQQ